MGSFLVLLGASWRPLGYLEGLLGVSWDPFGDLSSTKKFVLELLLASVDLDVLFLVSSLLACTCFNPFGMVIFRFCSLLSNIMCFFCFSEIDEGLDEFAGFEISFLRRSPELVECLCEFPRFS